MEIDLKALKNSGLFVDEFMFLAFINEGEDPLAGNYHWPSGIMERMENGMWIKYCEDTIELRAKAKELFENKNSTINFDEFWDVFPVTTPSGRILRAESKMWGTKPTKDYSEAKKKYLSKVKDVETHKLAVNAVLARVQSKDYEFINGIIPYINQQKWQQDIKYLRQQPIGKINKMI